MTSNSNSNSAAPRTSSTSSTSSPTTTQTNEEALAVYQSAVYGNEQPMMQMKKEMRMETEEHKENGNDGDDEEMEEEEEEEEDEGEEEDDNANDLIADADLKALTINAKEMLSQMEIKNQKNQVIDHMQIINRLGGTLAFLSSETEMEANNERMGDICLQLMDDFACVRQQIVKGDADIDFMVYSAIVMEQFDGEECEQRKCMAIERMSRAEEKEEEEQPQQPSSSPIQHILDAIHCAVLHGYDCGYKLYGNERERMRRMIIRNNRRQQNENDFTRDIEGECVRAMVTPRVRNLRGNGSNKFVTEISEAQQMEMKESQSNGNQNPTKPQQQPPDIFYAFGYKFYYWPLFKNNNNIDSKHNGGRDTFGEWYVEKKYKSLKEEVNTIVIPYKMNKTMKSGSEWMQTQYVKQMECTGDIPHYHIFAGSTPSLGHILSVLFHCDFTRLCRLFSQSFRKMTANETDDELRQRNAEFREFARLLVECVHAFGTNRFHNMI